MIEVIQRQNFLFLNVFTSKDCYIYVRFAEIIMKMKRFHPNFQIFH
jgi:hypothetical protein